MLTTLVRIFTERGPGVPFRTDALSASMSGTCTSRTLAADKSRATAVSNGGQSDRRTRRSPKAQANGERVRDWPPVGHRGAHSRPFCRARRSLPESGIPPIFAISAENGPLAVNRKGNGTRSGRNLPLRTEFEPATFWLTAIVLDYCESRSRRTGEQAAGRTLDIQNRLSPKGGAWRS